MKTIIKNERCLVCGKLLTGSQRKYCSKKCKYQHPDIKTQNYKCQQKRGRARKIELVISFGGECTECGYNKNLASLCFHHLVEKEKKFQLDTRNLSNRSLKAIYKEATKCKLLCHNCHTETHNPGSNFWNITN